jgi:RNA polymerase sigma-70 factor (ECF subfamily)
MAVAEGREVDLSPQTILGEYAPRVYAIARRMLGNEQDAEDVTQDVLLQMLRKADTFRGEANFTTWLHRVTVNAALEFRRKRAAHEQRHTAADFDELHPEVRHPRPGRRWAVPPDQAALDREKQRLIEQAIAELPESYRDVYVLADVEGLSNADIAAALGLGIPAVKSRLHRARMTMRHALRPHFEETPP